jgi:uncharacterized protein (TIGR00730 family)
MTLSRGEMHQLASERISEIAREFSEGFKLLEKYKKSVTFFGSTRATDDNLYYISARSLAGRIVKELNYSIVSGGGPGIMEAANRGAYESHGDSVGLLIDLPDGQPTNNYITESIGFYYFFARKVCLTFGAEVFIFYPGGFGTLDEFFEILTLVQTKKIENALIICVGSDYWNKIRDFMKMEMLDRGAIDTKDLELFTITDNHDEIVEIIKKAPFRDEESSLRHKL